MVSGREQSQLQLFHLQWELLLYRPERACSPAAPEVLVWEGVVWPSRVKDLNDKNLLPVRTKDMVASVKVSMCFPSGLRRLTWWWHCSPLKLQTHFCNKSGEGILGVGEQREGCLLSDHKAGGNAGSQLTSVLPGILLATLNAQERSQDTCKHVLTLPRNSFRALTYLILFWANAAGILPQIIPDKLHSKLYHTDKWRVKQNFVWSCIHFMEAVFSPPKKFRAIRKSISKLNECVITYIWQIFCNCAMCQLWKSKVIFPEQDYAWGWLVKC